MAGLPSTLWPARSPLVSVHRRHRAQVGPVVEGLGVDLEWRPVDGPVAGQNIEYGTAFGVGEFVGGTEGAPTGTPIGFCSDRHTLWVGAGTDRNG